MSRPREPERPAPGELGASAWADLAAERLGGWALAASDEFFAPKENLLRPGPGIFREGEYTARGKWMDGWETRRRRGSGHDWCIVRLGVPGAIRRITVDTGHFLGNHPEICSVDGFAAPEGLDDETLVGQEGWVELVPRSPLRADAENTFAVEDDRRWTHVRLNIYPDGGVARLRVYGRGRPDWERLLSTGGPVDLAAVENGGWVRDCSDHTFGRPANLLLPGRARHMGEGWETRRRRSSGHDWVILELGRRGAIACVELDTTHFKGNHPESFRLEGLDHPAPSGGDEAEALGTGGEEWGERPWRTVVARSPLAPHAVRRFRSALEEPVTHVRLAIFPDGGVSRLRLWGRPTADGATRADD